MTTHRCPVRGCRQEVPATLLMCLRHWRMVPKPIRDAVWATYADGSGVGSLAYLEAIKAAIGAVDAKLGGQR